MPFTSIGREVVRGTLCKDRWRAQVTLMCGDRLPVGAGSPLFLAIEWRDERDSPEVPDQPEDAKPVVLTLKKRSPASSGDVRFDNADGEVTKGFPGNARTVLTLFGVAQSSGEVADVDLEVKVEDEVRATIPLSVGPPATAVEIRAENGTDPAATHAVPDSPLRLRAVVAPTATGGTFRWVTLSDDTLEIRGSTTEDVVEVIPKDGSGDRQIMVLYTPPEGLSVMVAHPLQLATELTYRGRLLDTIGLPISGAEVTAELFNGDTLAPATTTGQSGTFEVRAPLQPELRIALRYEGEELTFTQTPTVAQMVAPVELGDLVMRIPVSLVGPVVDGSPAHAVDLARIQDRLLHLGRLSAADVEAEPIDPTSQVSIDIGTRPLLLAALCAQLRAGTGKRFLEVQPGDPTLDALNADPIFPIVPTTITGPVGEEPGMQVPSTPAINARANVRAVQDRLHQLGFLSTAGYRAERVDPASGPATTAAGTIPVTLGAIRVFDMNVSLGALRSIVPGRENARLLGDPHQFGLAPLKLSGTVGVGGVNRASDVRLVQDRLRTLGYLSEANYTAELVPVSPSDEPIEDSAIPQTIAALAAAHIARVGPRPTGEPDRIELNDPALDRLNHPPRVDLRSGVGAAEAGVENRAADVRAVQDRLRLLGFLSQANLDAERVNEARTTAVDIASIPQTMAALTAFRDAVIHGGAAPATPPAPARILPDERPTPITLTGTVGPGGANARADVREVQDRLLALRFLSVPDHGREVVDPARTEPLNPASLASTFAAIRALQQQVLRLPAEVAGQEWTAQGVIRPGDAAARLLSDPLFFGREKIVLRGSVGELGWNRRSEVRAIQDRLKEMRLLTEAHHTAEQVDPAQADAAGRAPVLASALVETRRAIARLREGFLGEPAPAIQRIDAASPFLLALRNPLLPTANSGALPALWRNVNLQGSVGAGGENRAADVRAVQDRLRDLGFMSPADHAAEAPAGANVADDAMRQTIAAVERFERRMLIPAEADGVIEPLDATNRLLGRPVLPPPISLGLTGSVGAGTSANQNPNLRKVQDRLHSLGILSTEAYLAERVPATGGGTNPAANIPLTIAAIERFQRTAAGGVDRIIGAGGMTERILNDPTHGTPTIPNPNTDYRNAGPAMPAFPQALQRIILAIEAHEAGGSTGEVPAILRNGSGTPASYGKAQVIGATGVGTLAGDAAFRAFYLDANELAELQAISTAATNRYNEIFALVPAPGLSEAALQAAIATYTAANLTAFRADTGLGRQDIVRCFRTAQLRRHCRAFIDSQPVPPGTPADEQEDARRTVAANAVGNFLANAERLANVNALGLKEGDVKAYLRKSIDGEHRAGFVSRALLHSVAGQKFRNALTDDSGFKIGRFVIRDNYNTVNNRATSTGVTLTDQQRAQIVARAHNSGPGGINGWVANPASAVNGYVNNVMTHWTP